MSDSTLFSLPEELLIYIAHYLTKPELKNLQLTCKFFNSLGNDTSVLLPFYNRLCAMAPTLPALLSCCHNGEKNALQVFKESFETIRKRQLEEAQILGFTYFAEELHGVYEQKPLTLEMLERAHARLNQLNHDTIKFNLIYSHNHLVTDVNPFILGFKILF